MHIYIGNLPLGTTVDELKKEFSAFGQVKSVNIIDDRDIGSGQMSGHGYVEMTSESEGKAAVAGLRDRTIKGRVIQVIESLGFSGHTNKNTYDSRRSGRFNRKIHRVNARKANNLL